MIPEDGPKVGDETILALKDPDHPRFQLKKYAVRCRDRGRGRVLNKNLRLRLDQSGNPEFIYHGTVIARLLPDGVRVNNGGFATFSTKSNINSILAMFTNSRIYQASFTWYVKDATGVWEYENDTVIPYSKNRTGFNRTFYESWRKRHNL